VLAGAGAAEQVAALGLARVPGVDVVDGFVDPTPYLAQASLTVNPLAAIRGSAVKVIESLAAGRAVVSTRDGARGFLSAEGSGLIVVGDMEAMASAVVRLLSDAAERHRLEARAVGFAARRTWSAAAALWADAIEQTIADHAAAP
jgi:glycosyltransferase involved in cell wall biosynthesis